MKDAQSKFREVECALGMGQRLNTSAAVGKAAQVMLRKEEYALDMGLSKSDEAEKVLSS